jgi:broad specificity phosphatase PhoE
MRDPLARRIRSVAIAALSAVLLVLISAIPSWAMTLTFVRHAESLANEAGIINTQVPGPGLSETGQEQAEAIAPVLADMGFDGIYVSSMLRTQQTAQPMLNLLPGSSSQILPGLREISAGIFEGASENEGLGRLGYVLAPITWLLGGRFVPVLGGEDGNSFDARVDGAIEQIADNGDENAVAFAHGATIMFWVMMNVDNPDLGLLLSHQLSNTESVVLEGSPEAGWTLVSWAGRPVAADPTLATKLFVNVRDLVVAPQTALYNIGKAFASGDLGALATAVLDGVVDVTRAVLRFIPDTVRDIVDEFRPPSMTPAEVTSEVASDITGVQRVAAIAAPQQQSDETQPQAVTVATAKERSGATDVAKGNTVTPVDEVTDDETTEISDDVMGEDVAEDDLVEDGNVEDGNPAETEADTPTDDEAPPSDPDARSGSGSDDGSGSGEGTGGGASEPAAA